MHKKKVYLEDVRVALHRLMMDTQEASKACPICSDVADHVEGILFDVEKILKENNDEKTTR